MPTLGDGIDFIIIFCGALLMMTGGHIAWNNWIPFAWVFPLFVGGPMQYEMQP